MGEMINKYKIGDNILVKGKMLNDDMDAEEKEKIINRIKELDAECDRLNAEMKQMELFTDQRTKINHMMINAGGVMNEKNECYRIR